MKRVPWVGGVGSSGRTAVLLVAAGLAACAGGEPGGGGAGAAVAAANPFEHCRALGVGTASAEFEECVNAYILERCSTVGEPGSDAHERCARDLRDATFVRDQLQIRGF